MTPPTTAATAALVTAETGSTPTSTQDTAAQDLISDVFASGCTSRQALVDVSSKWGTLSLLALRENQYRFNALRRKVEGVSEKMLSQALQTLERDGLVVRDVQTSIPPRVEYSLTPLGLRVAEQLFGLKELLEATTHDFEAARSAYDARTN